MAANDYELILMLDPQVGDEQREQLAADAKARVEAAGTLNHESTWGLRKLAFEVERRTEADYRYYRFNGDKALLDDLNHVLKITDGVLRFRIFAVDPQAPMIVPPDTEQIMRRDDDEDRGRGRGRRDDRGRRPRRDPAPQAPSREPEPRSDPEPAADPGSS